MAKQYVRKKENTMVKWQWSTRSTKIRKPTIRSASCVKHAVTCESVWLQRTRREPCMKWELWIRFPVEKNRPRWHWSGDCWTNQVQASWLLDNPRKRCLLFFAKCSAEIVRAHCAQRQAILSHNLKWRVAYDYEHCPKTQKFKFFTGNERQVLKRIVLPQCFGSHESDPWATPRNH